MTLHIVGFALFGSFLCLAGFYYIFQGIVCIFFITLCQINNYCRFAYHFLKLVPKFERVCNNN